MDQLALFYFLTSEDAGHYRSTILDIAMAVCLVAAWAALAVIILSTAYAEGICTNYWCYTAIWPAL